MHAVREGGGADSSEGNYIQAKNSGHPPDKQKLTLGARLLLSQFPLTTAVTWTNHIEVQWQLIFFNTVNTNALQNTVLGTY